MDIEELDGRFESGGVLGEKVEKHLSISVGRAVPQEVSVVV